MALVEYSSSSASDSEGDRTPAPAKESAPPPAKRLKTVDHRSTSFEARKPLPALPASFRERYSSTVRTSVQDDASLHAGRQRVTPHAVGHWPSHVYLECESENLLPFCRDAQSVVEWKGFAPPMIRYEGIYCKRHGR